MARLCDVPSVRSGDDASMPMIDVYASDGTFTDKHALARRLAEAVMRWEQVPAIPLFSDKQLGVVRELTDIVAAAAGDPGLVDRTWVLITEAPDGGWGIDGHANTGQDIVAAARAALAVDGDGN